MCVQSRGSWWNRTAVTNGPSTASDLPFLSCDYFEQSSMHHHPAKGDSRTCLWIVWARSVQYACSNILSGYKHRKSKKEVQCFCQARVQNENARFTLVTMIKQIVAISLICANIFEVISRWYASEYLLNLLSDPIFNILRKPSLNATVVERS